MPGGKEIPPKELEEINSTDVDKRKMTTYNYKLVNFEEEIMQKYGVNELRRMFLEFFESKDHLALKSFSLVPHNDKSLLLINSGMAPMKPYFTGQE